jgi:hypothetical protein
VLFSLIVMILLWVATAVRLPTLWRDRRQRALWTALMLLAVVKTISYPPIADRLHAAILPNLLGVAVAYCLLRFIALVTGAGTPRWQIVVTVGVLITLGVLAAIAGSDIDNDGNVLAGPLPPAAVAYWVVLEGYLGAVLVSTARLFRTVGRAAPAGLPRLGPIAFERIEPVAHVIQAAAILLAVAGSVVPATRRARAVVTAYGNLRKLRPLWRAMKEAFPEVILFSPRRALVELAGVDDVDLRLYRRVIEIRDGMLALRDYRPVDVPADPDPAVTEARGITMALARRASGGLPLEDGGQWAPVGPDMADEVAWLGRVSDAFRGLTPGGVPPDHARIPRPSGSAR